MRKIKDTTIYKKLKIDFFYFVNLILRAVNYNGWQYQYSKWVIDDGERNLFTNYPLNSKSVVIDVGGYKGIFSDRIFSIYNSHIIIFEPVKSYFAILKNKYVNAKNIKVFNYGLSNKNSNQKIYLSGDSTSLFRASDNSEKIKLIDIATIIKKFKTIDLLSINIEGGEYDVLERLIDTNLIKKIKFLQVQFHHFIPNANSRRKKIVKDILKTHKIHFSYPFVWESFSLRKAH
jgi:FkbM family methyltransferase